MKINFKYEIKESANYLSLSILTIDKLNISSDTDQYNQIRFFIKDWTVEIGNTTMVLPNQKRIILKEGWSCFFSTDLSDEVKSVMKLFNKQYIPIFIIPNKWFEI